MRILNNTKFKKIIGIFLVMVVLITGIGPSFTMPKVYAADEDNSGGMLAWTIAKFISWLSGLFQDLMDKCFGIPDTSPSLFISSIVYGDIDAFDVNIFNDTTLRYGSTNRDDAVLNSTVGATIAKYYGFCRSLAIAASLVILLYVGIRIVVSTAAGDLTKYKSLLKDWLLSLALVLMMHYIMSLVLFTSDSLTVMFKNIGGVAGGGGGTSFDFYEHINTQISTNAGNALMYSIIKIVFLAMTFAFILIYAKRTIMIAFLTIVAPLVGISYTIDKIKDGQSQILDKWTKEYIYTALIMPLDALLFTIVSSILMDLLNTGGNIILCVALLIGYLPLRGWFTEFISADKAGHAMGAMAAGAFMGNMLGKGGDTAKRKGDNSRSTTTNESGGNQVSDGGNSGAPGLSAVGGNSGNPGLTGGGNGTGLPGGSSSSRSGAPSSYSTNPNLLNNGTSSKASQLAYKLGEKGVKGLAKDGAKALGKKAARGSLNMAENAVARTAGLAKGGLKAAATMALTGNGGLALQQGISGYRSGNNNMIGKMDKFEASVGGTVGAITAEGLGKIRDHIGGSFDTENKRNNMMYEAEDSIMNEYDSSAKKAHSDYSDTISRLDQYANMSDMEFQSLSDDERSNVMSAVKDTIGEEDYNLLHAGEDQSQADLVAFQVAKERNFEGASTRASELRASTISGLVKDKDTKLTQTRNRYQNMSKANIQQEYRSNLNAASEKAKEERKNSSVRQSSNYKQGRSEREAGSYARNQRKEQLKAGQKKKNEIEIETASITPRQINTNSNIEYDINDQTRSEGSSYDTNVDIPTYNNEPEYVQPEIVYEGNYIDNSINPVEVDYVEVNDESRFLNTSYNNLTGADRTEALEIARDCIGKDAYNQKVSEIGKARADQWAFETARDNGFKQVEIVKESVPTTPNNINGGTYKSNEKVERSNENRDIGNEQDSIESRREMRRTNEQTQVKKATESTTKVTSKTKPRKKK